MNIASQIGNLVNITELSSTVGISDKTIQQYLWYLEETFILKKVTPYHRNVRSEITKSPIYYFYDTGLRNYLFGLFGIPVIPSALSGHLFENIIFHLIRLHAHFASTRIHFWRTTDNAEVDFVVSTGLDVIPVEVKYTRLSSVQTSRSFKSFLDKYKPEKAYVVHLGEKMEETFDTTKIVFLPFYESADIMKDLQ